MDLGGAVVGHVLDLLARPAHLVLDDADVRLGLFLPAVDDQPPRALRQVENLPRTSDSRPPAG
jgi:hypothetical protein